MQSDEQTHARPSEPVAGAEQLLDLTTVLAELRRAPLRDESRHRQIALAHSGPVKLVLFAFETGGHLKEHAAPGWVTIHVLRGTLNVRVESAKHELTAGNILSLAPRTLHEVDAPTDADMLLGIYPATQNT